MSFSFADLFDNQFISKNKSITFDDVEIVVDYLLEKKTKIKTNIENNGVELQDIMLFRESQQIAKVTDVRESTDFECVFGVNVLNFETFIKDGVMTSIDIETTIGELLIEYWTNNDDSKINLPVSYITTSTTDGDLKFFDVEINSFQRILERAINKYSIVAELSLDLVNLTLIVTIGVKELANLVSIRLSDPFIAEYKLNITDTVYNKLLLYNKDEFEVVSKKSFYLLTDGSVTEDESDINRFDPVIEKVDEVEDSDFNLEYATGRLQGLQYNNEIKLTIATKLLNPQHPIVSLKVGDFISIYADETELKSQITKFEIKNTTGLITYTCGFGRNSLTDKLKREEI